MYYISRTGGVTAAAALIAASIFSFERARADVSFRANSPNAVEMQPGNTEYLMFRALQVEYDGGDPRPLLERAAGLNPLDSAPRIRLGLDAEVRGNFATAEKWLLDAAKIDRQFEPRWTLANFYFRRGNRDQFWTWMRQAFEVSYGDRRPAFELCWQMSDRADEILSRAIPDRPEVLGAYLAWLLDTRRPHAIPPVAMKLASEADDRPLVLAAEDALVEFGDGTNALALWRAIGLTAPDGLYRGNFEGIAIGHGFDWRWNEIGGAVHADIDQLRTRHRISFDGREPESCELLRQALLLKKGALYHLRWEASTSQIGSPSGIEWRIGDAHANVGNGRGEIEFVAPADLLGLTLVYQRPTGQVRAEGTIELWDVKVGQASSLRRTLSPPSSR